MLGVVGVGGEPDLQLAACVLGLGHRASSRNHSSGRIELARLAVGDARRANALTAGGTHGRAGTVEDRGTVGGQGFSATATGLTAW